VVRPGELASRAEGDVAEVAVEAAEESEEGIRGQGLDAVGRDLERGEVGEAAGLGQGDVLRERGVRGEVEALLGLGAERVPALAYEPMLESRRGSGDCAQNLTQKIVLAPLHDAGGSEEQRRGMGSGQERSEAQFFYG